MQAVGGVLSDRPEHDDLEYPGAIRKGNYEIPVRHFDFPDLEVFGM